METEIPHRLKIKIGEHEFEAEGSPEIVQKQFEIFKELVANSPKPDINKGESQSPEGQSISPLTNNVQQSASIDQSLEKIMKADGRVVSLTVRPENAQSAALLIIYGQKVLRGTEQVTGGEVADGLTSTGGFSVPRIDRVLNGLGSSGDLIITGERRGRRYRLTNSGLTRARDEATKLVAIVP